jgi:hypothetical protein
MSFFYRTFLFTAIGSIVFCSCKKVIIEEGIEDAGQQCYRITTPNAIFFYQKEAGGFSSILDRDGNDWIGFRPDIRESYPSSAATSFRGLPNLVFRSDDGGAGHPGFKKCFSEQVSGNQIRTTAKSENWQWTWTFYSDFASITINRIDSAHAYWFLYEGTVGGRFKPQEQYWGTDQGGPLFSTPDYYNGEPVYDNWKWFYVGDEKLNRIFFIIHETTDDLTDTFSYLGNTNEGVHSQDGMVVFGFGRTENATPLMNESGQTFKIGFIDKRIRNEEDHLELRGRIKKIMNQ